MGMLGLDDEDKIIGFRKRISRLKRKAQERVKPTSCILCGKNVTSFCNSHSVPRMILRRIAEDGKVLYSNASVDLELMDKEGGLNNTGTFYLICQDCDNHYFADYEDPSRITERPDDLLLAQIALKSTLLELYRRMVEIELFNMIARDTGRVENYDVYERIKTQDIKDYKDDIALYKSIIDNKTKGGFQVLLWEKLPYVVPIASQALVVLMYDLEGNLINDVFDDSLSHSIDNANICVFPTDNESIVLFFYHKKAKAYRKFRHQFNTCSLDTKLRFINWALFEYTENIFFSRRVREIVESDKNLQAVTQQIYGNPNFGVISGRLPLNDNANVGIYDIPNFLSSAYSLEND